jgi:hypothetical protein
MSADEILERLAELSKQIEAHKTAAWLAEREVEELRARLRQMHWTPPVVKKGSEPSGEFC